MKTFKGCREILTAGRAATLILAVFGIVACSERAPETPEGPWGGAKEAKERATKGKLLFEEKCRTVAGEKIYRTVPNVEGIVLLKIRPLKSDHELADLYWPGAAFAIESSGDSYITTFLGYEYAPGKFRSNEPQVVTPQERGYINTQRRRGGLPGYRFVDVVDEKDGQRYRYVGRWEERWLKDNTKYLKGDLWFSLEKSLATAPAPRFGVTFDDQVRAEDRALGVASSTIKVIDLETKEVLGQLTRYAWSPGGPSNANPAPWLTAYKCPGHAVGSDAATRKFVDQILIPNREE